MDKQGKHPKNTVIAIEDEVLIATGKGKASAKIVTILSNQSS